MNIEAGILKIPFDRDEGGDVIAEREPRGGAALEIDIAVTVTVVPSVVVLL